MSITKVASKGKRGGFWPSNMRTDRYKKGENPCGNCGTTQHTQCRPRLNGTLCSCSCNRAQSFRDIYEQSVNAAKRAGDPVPTVLEAMSFILPRLTKRIEKSLHTHEKSA